MNDLVSHVLVDLSCEVSIVQPECEGVRRDAVEKLGRGDALQIVAFNSEPAHDGIPERWRRLLE